MAAIKEIGTTIHDEWYGNLRNNGPTFEKWYNHVVDPESNDWLSHLETPKIVDINEETGRGVMNGSIPSAVVNTGAMSNVGKYGCSLELTGKPSNTVFSTAKGQQVNANEEGRMEHELKEPTRTFNIVPDITLDPLASTSKMCDAGYFSVFDKEEVWIYNAQTTKFTAPKPLVLKRWRDKVSTIWRIPLVKQAPTPDFGQMTNRTPGTYLTSCDAQKQMYSPFPPAPSERIANVYQLRTKPEVIHYLHAAAGFSAEATWHGAVKNGNYTS